MKKLLMASVAVLCHASLSTAAELEVTHWWTSGSEADAVRVLANAFNATGNAWKDGAIAGAGGVARPLITSRITGGAPMGATQFTHGKAMNELIQAGLMRDVTDIARRDGWLDKVYPASLLKDCTFEGRVYCVPSNIHSQQWLWVGHKAFETARVQVPKNWDEFVASAPALEEKGIVPLAVGRQPWQIQLLFNVLMVSVGGPELFERVYDKKDAEYAAGPDVAKVFAAAADARRLSAKSNVQEWNLATQMVIDGRAGAQIMGDWVQGEFTHAGLVAGKNFECLPGLGLYQYITTAGDAFYFPKVSNPDIIAAQDALASVIVDPAVQVKFNLTKGALPVRSDVDMADATPCMKRGLDILAKGQIVRSVNSMISPDSVARITDLVVEFFSDAKFTPERAQKEFVDIIKDAD
ncbi:ABC transporter substrate-binding protein [Agrobacterium sp. T29]|uniref:ABC transporter substrate-binding protein n=1 Tax=Agrobacterium sp. T29 TaxID=2580515 RepID=UPI00115E5B7A|nr:ABC transporter substrate-binding protein [Agrobacterium sp. T29]